MNTDTRESMESQHPLAYKTVEKYRDWMGMWSEVDEGNPFLPTIDEFFLYPGTTQILSQVDIGYRYRHIVMYAGTGDEGGSAVLYATWDIGFGEQNDPPILVNLVQEFDTMFSTIWGTKPFSPNPEPQWLSTPELAKQYFDAADGVVGGYNSVVGSNE